MKSSLILLLIFSVTSAFAQIDAKKVGSDMAVMTRSMDRLFARQEMKDSLATQMLRAGLKSSNPMTSSEIDQKVLKVTDEDSLKNCVSNYSETKSPSGDKVDALVEYKGSACPIAITAKIHIVASGSGADGDVDLQIDIVNEALKKDLGVAKFVMPMKLKVVVKPSDQGFQMNMDMAIGAKITSLTFGLVDYSGDFSTAVVFGQTMTSKVTTVETYNAGGQRIKFETISESDGNVQKETYSVNGVATTKAEFDQKHTTITIPGFGEDDSPLARPHNCDIKAYDSAIYSLEAVRKSIKENTTESLKTSEVFPRLTLVQAGKMPMQIVLSGQNIEMEVATTPDAARFNFEKKIQGKPPELLGRITALLGEKVDLTKVILGRVVRVTCAPL